jgi:hypothetical protein
VVFPLHCGYVCINGNQEDKKNEISIREGYWKCMGKLYCELKGGGSSGDWCVFERTGVCCWRNVVR